MKIEKTIKLVKDLLLAKILNRKIPFKITHNLTYRCNLICPFCLLRNSTSGPNAPEMSTLSVKKMMREFKEMGTRFWLFSGGEPLLREDLGELIDYAKNKMGFYCGISTNATLLAEKIEKEPSFKQADLFQISLQGPKQIHDNLCGKGTYDKIISALGILKELRIKTVILALLLKDNLDYLPSLIELANRYNANIVLQVLGSRPAATVGLEETFFPDKDKFKKVIEGLAEQIRKNKNHRIVSSLSYLEMVKNYWSNQPHGITCYAGSCYCEITPDGFVAPCCAKLNIVDDNLCGLKVGFKKAFLRLNNMSECRDCYYAGPQELNTIFSMFPLKAMTIYKNYFHAVRPFLKSF